MQDSFVTGGGGIVSFLENFQYIFHSIVDRKNFNSPWHVLGILGSGKTLSGSGKTLFAKSMESWHQTLFIKLIIIFAS